MNFRIDLNSIFKNA